MNPPRPAGFPYAATALLLIATLFLVLLLASMLHSIGIFSLNRATDLNIFRGTVEIRHIYDFHFAPAVPEADSFAVFVARGWTVPAFPNPFPGFSFQDELVRGESWGSGTPIWPNKYWLLRLPLWPLAILPAIPAAWLFRRWNRRRQRSLRGFEVLPAP